MVWVAGRRVQGLQLRVQGWVQNGSKFQGLFSAFAGVHIKRLEFSGVLGFRVRILSYSSDL